MARRKKDEAEEILDRYFPILDHGFIALKDYMGSDEDIEEAARISYHPDSTRKRSETRGLIRYLQRHRHTTPTEMVELKFHVAMPIFVARQWVRHRTASLNEMSGRYSLLPLLFYTPDPVRKQSKTNRQGSSEEKMSTLQEHGIKNWWRKGRNQSSNLYNMLNQADVARELARIDLPLSTYTQWYWKIDLHNLLHFLSLRCDPHAQWEIRAYAEVMAGMVERVAPLTYEAWIDYDFCGTRLSRAEREILTKAFWWLEDDEGDELISTTRYIPVRYMKENLGMSSREVQELKDKLETPEVPDFSIDVEDSKDPEYFAEKMSSAVPNNGH